MKCQSGGSFLEVGGGELGHIQQCSESIPVLNSGP